MEKQLSLRAVCLAVRKAVREFAGDRTDAELARMLSLARSTVTRQMAQRLRSGKIDGMPLRTLLALLDAVGIDLTRLKVARLRRHLHLRTLGRVLFARRGRVWPRHDAAFLRVVLSLSRTVRPSEVDLATGWARWLERTHAAAATLQRRAGWEGDVEAILFAVGDRVYLTQHRPLACAARDTLQAAVKFAAGRVADAEALAERAAAVYRAVPAVDRWLLGQAAHHRQYAYLLRRTWRGGEAEEWYRKSILLSKQLASAHHSDPACLLELWRGQYDLARLLQERGEWRGARQQLDEVEDGLRRTAMDVEPDRERRLLISRCCWLRALIYRLCGDQGHEACYAEATDIRRELVADAPQDANFRNELGWLLAANPYHPDRHTAEAAAHACAAARLAPEVGNYANTLGIALIRAGDAAGAITALERARRFHADLNVLDWLFLAMAHRETDGDEAKRYLGRAKGKIRAALSKGRTCTDDEVARFLREAGG